MNFVYQNATLNLMSTNIVQRPRWTTLWRLVGTLWLEILRFRLRRRLAPSLRSHLLLSGLIIWSTTILNLPSIALQAGLPYFLVKIVKKLCQIFMSKATLFLVTLAMVGAGEANLLPPSGKWQRLQRARPGVSRHCRSLRYLRPVGTVARDSSILLLGLC